MKSTPTEALEIELNIAPIDIMEAIKVLQETVDVSN